MTSINNRHNNIQVLGSGGAATLLQHRRAQEKTQLGSAQQSALRKTPLFCCHTDLIAAGSAAMGKGNLKMGSTFRVKNQVTYTDNGNKNRKSNKQQHPGIPRTSGKRGWCLFEKEMLRGVCGKKGKSVCGQRMPENCSGSFPFSFLSPQINCNPSLTKEWPPW